MLIMTGENNSEDNIQPPPIGDDDDNSDNNVEPIPLHDDIDIGDFEAQLPPIPPMQQLMHHNYSDDSDSSDETSDSNDGELNPMPDSPVAECQGFGEIASTSASEVEDGDSSDMEEVPTPAGSDLDDVNSVDGMEEYSDAESSSSSSLSTDTENVSSEASYCSFGNIANAEDDDNVSRSSVVASGLEEEEIAVVNNEVTNGIEMIEPVVDQIMEPRDTSYLKKFLIRASPFSQPDFEPDSEIVSFIEEKCRVLVIGAGGLGCELLKDLGMIGFRNIHVIDMDTIELSNLNRQFLFRKEDIGKPKAVVAANFIEKRIPGCKVRAHHAKIQDFDEDFYKRFNIVISGLDSIVARRWINNMLVSLLIYNDSGEIEHNSVVPLVDGGTEGFKGNVRVILPGLTACLECTLDLFPPQVTFPLCTIATTPRLPEHCIEYVKVIQWPKENPFGASLDGDDPTHINWVYEKALKRASEFGITGVTYRLVQGVVKNIIPAVASTNAAIAAACVTEAFKLATGFCTSQNNYMLFNDIDGVYTYSYETEKKDDCLVCRKKFGHLTVPGADVKLEDVITTLKESSMYGFKNPAITALIEGKNKTLYMPTVESLEEYSQENLKKTLRELGLTCGTILYVSDPSSTVAWHITLKISE